MFLDDQLLEIGRNADVSTAEGLQKAITLMINACFSNLQEKIGDNKTGEIIHANFKRVNNTWRMVAEKLKKEDNGFIKTDGFEIFVNSKPEFEGIFLKKQ